MKVWSYAAAVAGSCCLAATSGASADEHARERAVLAATVRQQIQEHLTPASGTEDLIVCVGIKSGGAAAQSPTAELMAELGRPVRGLAECKAKPEGAVESRSGRAALILTVGPIDWRAADEAWVTVRFFRTGRESALRRYRVVQERSGWVSLGPILLDGPV